MLTVGAALLALFWASLGLLQFAASHEVLARAAVDPQYVIGAGGRVVYTYVHRPLVQVTLSITE